MVPVQAFDYKRKKNGEIKIGVQKFAEAFVSGMLIFSYKDWVAQYTGSANNKQYPRKKFYLRNSSRFSHLICSTRYFQSRYS